MHYLEKKHEHIYNIIQKNRSSSFLFNPLQLKADLCKEIFNLLISTHNFLIIKMRKECTGLGSFWECNGDHFDFKC